MTKRQITFFATNGFYQDRQRDQAFREYGRRDELFLTRDGRNLVTITDQTYDERSDRYQQQILVNLDNVSDESDDLTDGDLDYGREYYQPLLNSIASIPQPQTSFFIDLDPVPWLRDTVTTHEYLKQGTNSGQIAEITPVYNYYAGRYQRLAARTDERVLPNIYSREICRILRDESEDNWLGSDLARQNATSFCEDFDADLLPQTPEEINTNRRFERVVFPQTELKEILALDERKNLYPMYVNITFPTDTMGPLMRAIKKAKLSTTFYNRLLSLQNEINNVSATGVHNGVVLSRNDYVSRTLRYDNINVTSFSILDLVNNLIEEALEGELEDAQNAEFLTLRGAERLPNDSPGSCLNLLDKVYLMAIKSEIEQILKVDKIPSLFDTVDPRSDIRTRSSRQDLLKETFKQEIVGYSIEKRRPNGELLGDYYFPNTNDLDVLKYTDTQVRYNTEYDYEVFAHVITVGQKIIDIFPQSVRGVQSITSTAVKDLILVKVPLFSPDLVPNESTRAQVSGYAMPRIKLLDRPPVPPNITFLPFKEASTEILIKAERMTDELTGNRTIPYIPILGDAEERRFIERANYQRIENFDLPDGHVEFKSEGEDANEVQVFRTTEEPQYTGDPEENTVNVIQRQAYANFAIGGVYTTLTANTGLAFTDKLKTNTKYYYTFRMKDVNGNVSNPTDIIQVEIVETEGITYPVIQEYIPTRSQPKKQKSRNLAQFIQIRPSYLGSEPLPDEEGRQIAGQAVEETPFGKHFKIRLTSKDTGRQIDLNCLFEKAVLTNEENE
mgnify:CR=1 FL=1|tara:strand:- start:1435 stop:3789 length:2355 start_codon:yes stop_codon:yes gene_type:complete